MITSLSTSFGDAEYGMSEGVDVYRKTTEGWIEETRLTSLNPSENEGFAGAIAIYEDYIALGATGYSIAGGVYIFRKEAEVWVNQAILTPLDPVEAQNFGEEVALFENQLIVGVPTDPINGLTNSGSAYIFRREGNTWIEEAKIVPNDPLEQAIFGRRVAIQGNYAFVGATRAANDEGLQTGAVYVFKKEVSGWAEKQKLTPVDGNAPPFGGFDRVLASNNILFIGSSLYHDAYNGGGGYLYQLEGDEWVEEFQIEALNEQGNDQYLEGWAFWGEYVALSIAPSAGIPQPALVHLFKRNENEWERIRILFEESTVNDRYGHDIALTDQFLFVGAESAYCQNGTDSVRTGAVYVYDLDEIVVANGPPASEIKISIFPNPMNEITTINFFSPIPFKIDQLAIYDLHGQLVKNIFVNESPLSQQSWQVEMSGLASGTYFLRGIGEQQVFSKRLIFF